MQAVLRSVKILQDRVLRRLCDAELDDRLGRNVNLLTRGRVASHSSRTVLLHQLTDTRERELTALLRLLVCELDEGIHKRGDLLLRVTGRGSECIHEL